MAFNYSGDPSDSNRDAVRFLSGDTDSNDQLLQDAEVDWILTEEDNSVYLAAAMACETIASKFARQADKSGLEFSIKASQKAETYRKQAAKLRDIAQTQGAEIFVGGYAKSDSESLEEDDGLIQPEFMVGMDDWREEDTTTERNDT